MAIMDNDLYKIMTSEDMRRREEMRWHWNGIVSTRNGITTWAIGSVSIEALSPEHWSLWAIPGKLSRCRLSTESCRSSGHIGPRCHAPRRWSTVGQWRRCYYRTVAEDYWQSLSLIDSVSRSVPEGRRIRSMASVWLPIRQLIRSLIMRVIIWESFEDRPACPWRSSGIECTWRLRTHIFPDWTTVSMAASDVP